MSRALSIVVPAFNEQRDLPELLTSIQTLARDPRVEVLVVDNGSSDATARIASEFGARVVAVSRMPIGQARNAGARAAEGRLLAFLDADIRVTPSWVRTVLDLASSVPAGEITGDTCDVSPTPSWLERRWFGAIYLRGVRNYINSGNLVMWKADFDRIGGFDPSLQSGEDVDLCKRAQESGIRLTARRALHVHHLGFPRTLKQFMRREAWHGRGDFASMRHFVASPVAQAALGFVALHGVMLIGLLAGNGTMTVGGIVLVLGLCAACALWKFRAAPFMMRVANIPICYAYLLGRACSLYGLRVISR